jgi:Mn2+/Fe2+ NRAMP family transporter
LILPNFNKLKSMLSRKESGDRRGTPGDRGKVIVMPSADSDAENTKFTFVGRIVPGIIAGAADLDPAAVLTATVAGASFGISLGWVVLLSIPILQSIFAVAARIGHETKLGLIKLVRENFGHKTAIVLACMVVAVNVLMIVADVMAVSDGLSILLLQPRRFFPGVVAFVVWLILTRTSYGRVNNMLSLMALFLLAYVAAAYLASDSLLAVAKGVVFPKFGGGTAYVLAVIAIFGSLQTPDVIVWQTSTKRETGAGFHGIESRIGCLVACIVSLSVIVAASSMKVANVDALTPRLAAEALAPLGQLGPILFDLGIVGSGLVALPILVASLCFSISEAADWDYGLNKPPWEAPRFFVLICVVLVFAVVLNYFGINTVKTLYWSQVLAGMFIMPILFFILWIANDRRIMKTTNGRWDNFWLGGAVGGMAAANIVFFWSQLMR